MLAFSETPGSRVRVVAVALVLGLALAFAWKLGFFGLTDRAAMSVTIARARSLRNVGLLFVGTYALAAGIGVPVTPLTIIGGALFGARLGVPMNWLGAMLAAMIGFAITKSTGLRASRRTMERHASIALLAQEHPRTTLFRLRVIPVAPFALLNAGAAISGMSWGDFIIATGLGIIPVTVIYTVFASTLVAGVEGSGRRAMATALVSAVVLIGASFLPIFARARRRRVIPASDAQSTARTIRS